MKLSLSVLLIFGLSSVSVAVPDSNYSEQEQRKIKALSQDEIDGYLTGKGMGLAKSAELNSFPGPKHVLELFQELSLSKPQIKETKRIYEAMESKAIAYGQLLVKKEEEIEKLFSKDTVSPQVLKIVLSESAEIKSKLREVHLMAHIEQKAVLTKHQTKLYDTLRGYVGGNSTQEGHRSHH